MPYDVPVRDVRVGLAVVMLPVTVTHNETAPSVIESEFLQSNNRGAVHMCAIRTLC